MSIDGGTKVLAVSTVFGECWVGGQAALLSCYTAGTADGADTNLRVAFDEQLMSL